MHSRIIYIIQVSFLKYMNTKDRVHISIWVCRDEYGCIRTCFRCVSQVYPLLSEVKDLPSKNGIQIHQMTFMDNGDYPVRFCCTQLVAAVTCTKMQLKDLHNQLKSRVSYSKILNFSALHKTTLSKFLQSSDTILLYCVTNKY